MKKLFTKPGFEFIFALGLIIILGLPPVLMAQVTHKDLDISISNGDTTINGKNIKDLSPADRQQALTDINNIQNHTAQKWKRADGNTYMFKRRDTLGRADVRAEFRKRKMDDNGPAIAPDFMVNDSLGTIIENTPRRKAEQQRMVFKYKLRPDDGEQMDRPGSGDVVRFRSHGWINPRMFDRKNSQNFSYETTDNNGVSTHVTFHVSEANDDDLKRMPHVEGGKFDITDLNIVPQFTTGKTILLFNLPNKAAAVVKLHDSEGKLLWSEKVVGGSFSKTFALGLNGTYYLQVKQGSNIAIKKIFKEE